MHFGTIFIASRSLCNKSDNEEITNQICDSQETGESSTSTCIHEILIYVIKVKRQFY